MKINSFYKKIIILQVVADYVSVIFSFIIGYLIWRMLRLDVPFQMLVYLKLACLYGFLYLFIFWLVRLYEEELSIVNVEQLRRIIKGWIIGSGLLFSIGFLSKELSFSRLTFVFSLAILLFVLITQRFIFFKLCQKLHKKGIGNHRTLVVGTDDAAVGLFNILVNSPWLGIVPAGFVDDERLEVIGRDNKVYAVLGKVDKLEEIITIHKIDQIIISYSQLSREKLQYILDVCQKHKVIFKIIPHFYNAHLQRISVKNLLGIPLLYVDNSKSTWLYLVIKKTIDFIISLIALICLSPVMLVLALLIKINSSGPVLFSQERVGLNGKLFKIYKFRSMYAGANKYEICPKALEDPRITKIGKFIRRTSLDELPQFVNVLKGDMSIVGPRPEMQFIVEKYNDIQKERLRIRPGITGLWQISHQRGSPIHENIDLDIYYIDNQSLTMDLAIILNTLFSVIRGIGAC